MANLLCIDTASAECAVALSDGQDLKVRRSRNKLKAAQEVLPMIASCLDEAGQSLAQLDAIAVMAGPGSFTGIRIGLSAAQGLAFPHDLPIVCISALAVQAMRGLRMADLEARVAVVCDQARDNECYFAAYASDPSAGVTLIGREQVAAVETLEITELHAQVSAGWIVIADDANRVESLGTLIGSGPLKSLTLDSSPIETLAELAQLRFALGEGVPADQARPNYVKEEMTYDKST